MSEPIRRQNGDGEDNRVGALAGVSEPIRRQNGDGEDNRVGTLAGVSEPGAAPVESFRAPVARETAILIKETIR